MYRTQHQPYAKQAEALQKSEGQAAFAYLMAMRTGKTKVTIDDFGRLVDRDEVKDFLGIAPAAVYETWAGAFREHFDLEMLGRTKIYVWSAGRRADRALTEFMAYRGPRVLMVNVEALSSVARARELCLEYSMQRGPFLAVDESTIIKNARAKRSAFVIEELAPLSSRRRILSGLPSPRSPLDLFAQFDFLDRRILSDGNVIARPLKKRYAAFEAKYAVTRQMKIGGRRFNIVVGYKNLPDLERRISPHMFRVLLSDCYDLPAKIYQQRAVALTDEQRRIYGEVKKNATASLGGEAHVTATEVIVQMLRMHQVLCGHVVDELGVLHEVPENRTRELLSLLEEYDGKAIVWCSYNHNIEKVSAALRKEYGDASVAQFWGGNKSTREAEEVRFQRDPKCRFMVATAAAGGRGRQWAAADLVVYYSNTADLEHRSQSEERTQAVGKTKPVLYVDLVAPGTVDEKMIAALRAKIDLSTAILGDDYQEWLI